MALILRTQKGSKLTHTEVDGNFQFLQQQINNLPTGGGTGGASPANIFYANTRGLLGGGNDGFGNTNYGPDDTQRLQDSLDALSDAGGGEFVQNLRSDVTPFFIPSNVTIRILAGCGFRQRLALDGSGNPIRGNYYGPFIRNRNPSGHNQNNVITDKNIAITGEGYINGSGWVNGDWGQLKEKNSAGGLGWAMPLRFAGVDGLRVEGIRIVNPRSFAYMANNVQNVTIERNYVVVAIKDVTATGNVPYGNTDGFKHVGPFRNVRLINNTTITQDDGFSFCSCDIFWPNLPLPSVPAGQVDYDPFASCGDGIDFSVLGHHFGKGNNCGARILVANGYTLSGQIDNVTGEVNFAIGLIADGYRAGNAGSNEALFRAGNPASNGYLDSLVVNNWNVRRNVSSNFGDILVGAIGRRLELNNITKSNFAGNDPVVLFDPNCNFEHVKVSINARVTEGSTRFDKPLIRSRGNINLLDLSGAYYYNPGGAINAAYMWQESGSIGRLVGSDIDLVNTYPLYRRAGGTLGSAQFVRASMPQNGGGAYGLLELGDYTLPSYGLTSYDGEKAFTGNTPTRTYGDFFTSGGSGGGGTTPPPQSGQLTAPTNGQASPNGAGTLSVIASSVAGASGYRLYHSATAGGTYTQIGGTLSSPFYTHSGLAASTTHYYKWQAVGNGSTYTDSAQSAVFSGTVQATSTTPPTGGGVGDTTPTASLPTASLVAYWDFSEDAGDFTSKLGNYPLTRFNGAATGAGKIGNGLVLSAASNQYVKGPGPARTGDFTVGGWAVFNPNGTYQHLASVWNGADPNQQEWVVFFNPDRAHFDGTQGVLEVNVRPTGSSAPNFVFTKVPVGVPFLWVLRWSGSTLYLTVNGEIPQGDNNKLINEPIPVTGLPIAFGARSTPDGFTWNGLIDDVFYYTRGINEGEISYFLNSGAGRAYPS